MPSTGEDLATVPAGTESDVADAYDTAVEAQSDWAARSPAERREIVRNVLELLEDELIDLLVAELGSTRTKARGELTIASAVTRHATTPPARATGKLGSSDVPVRENLVQRGGTIAVGEAEVHNDGDLVVSGRATYFQKWD